MSTLSGAVGMKVLVVEDEAAIRRLLRHELQNQGLTVAEAATLLEARAAWREQVFDILILDLSLPDGSGLELLEEVRRSGSTSHVIVLSGAGTEADRVRGLVLGADDYVIKPFSILELNARVLAIRRRLDPAREATLCVGAVTVDLAARQVSVEGRPIETTAKEFDLLAFLAARPGVVFSRDDLLRGVWSSAPEWQVASTVTEHVRRLRAKIERDPRHPMLLRTVRGAGYRLDPPIPLAGRGHGR